MRKTIWFITTLLFLIWILPLGVFIKPSQEEKACNGQRAICLCSHLVAKQMAKNADKKIYKSGAGSAQKEQSGPGGAGHQFLLTPQKNQNNNQLSFYHHEQSTFYSFLVVQPVEHVPKV